ncbi:MAG TPA: alcohol dehydrogenase catalytic domain-containing protein [Spirochaetia bacterium]|nr:alcohol dehydrogenase catalytic domain-containing protein [Spirochaetia bacterium]
MNAAIFTGIENIEVREVDLPRCEPGGMVVEVKACGLCGSDIRNFHSGLRHGVKQQIMGHEIAGIVKEAGKEVSRFRPDDRVAIAPDVSCGKCYYCKRCLVNLCENHRLIGTHWPGGFAQYIGIPAEVMKHGMVHIMPEDLTFQAAALSEPASSVLASQANAGIGLGDTVLIIGDGPVGCLHLEVARARGASTVIMVGLTRLEAARRFEPDSLIDAASQDPVEEVRRITEGLGADVAIIANPVAKTQEQGVEAVRKRGRVILFGGLPNTKPMTALNSNLIHYNEITVVGAFSYPAPMHEMALRVIGEGKIQAEKYIDKIVPLEGIVEGIDSAESGQAMKVVVDPWLKVE